MISLNETNKLLRTARADQRLLWHHARQDVKFDLAVWDESQFHAWYSVQNTDLGLGTLQEITRMMAKTGEFNYINSKVLETRKILEGRVVPGDNEVKQQDCWAWCIFHLWDDKLAVVEPNSDLRTCMHQSPHLLSASLFCNWSINSSFTPQSCKQYMSYWSSQWCC